MEFSDKTLVCRDCGGQFVFTAGEQSFYQEKGLLNEPQRCPDCRASRRRERSGGGRAGGQRTGTTVICASCGQSTTVPFVPRDDRPVYCSSCYQQMRTGSSLRE